MTHVVNYRKKDGKYDVVVMAIESAWHFSLFQIDLDKKTFAILRDACSDELVSLKHVGVPTLDRALGLARELLTKMNDPSTIIYYYPNSDGAYVQIEDHTRIFAYPMSFEPPMDARTTRDVGLAQQYLSTLFPLATVVTDVATLSKLRPEDGWEYARNKIRGYNELNDHGDLLLPH